MNHILYLSLGSNLGDRHTNLSTAISLLPPKIQPINQSSIYETEPWGYLDQPTFLNLVVQATTHLNPQEVLTYIKGIEVTMGREESVRYGPRLIDLDILFYDDLILDSPELIIPHPHLAERGFVLLPLGEIAAKLKHPVSGKSIQQLISSLEISGVKIYHTSSS